MQFEIIETSRLLLRKVTPDVYAYVFRQYDDEQLQAFFGFQTPEELKKESDRFQKGLTTFNKTFVNFHLLDKTNGRNIGSCGFHTWYMDHARAEIGYALTDESLRQQGFMGEALEAIVAYGFDTLQLNRIEAFIGPENTASQRLVKKLHFLEEGRLRQHYFKNNRHEDSIVFALLRSEYREHKNN